MRRTRSSPDPRLHPATADASADRGERAETPAAKGLGAYEDRVKLAEQERSIGQLDQAPGAPVHWVSGAHDRQARRHTAPLLGTDDRGAQRGGYLIRAGRRAVPDEVLSLLRRRGCLVVRGHFDRGQALGWDRDIVDYVDGNRFFKDYRGPGDDFFGSVGSTDSGGLGTHLDPGTLDLWMTEAYQKAFRHLFDGTVEQYDPWDAAYRTAGPQYPGSTMCSAFRTFQGWTALSDMAHDQGVLQTVPIPGAMAYLMLRPLLSDVPDDEMCGVTV